jgi:hypothetical protein
MQPASVAEHFCSLIMRTQYLHAEHERRGFHRNRHRDLLAIEWCIEQLRRLHPVEYAEAEARVGAPAMNAQHMWSER